MAMLTSKSRRFSRSFNYTMPEYRDSSPRGKKVRMNLAVPATHERRPGDRNQTGETRS